MNDQLKDLRSQLEQINGDLLALLQSRQKTVTSIQLQKKEMGMPLFDAPREKKVFESLLGELEKLSELELLAFSLIMQSQVADRAYPNWFKKVHLCQFSDSVWEQINPILVKVVRESEFNQLTLSADFDFIRNI